MPALDRTPARFFSARDYETHGVGAAARAPAPGSPAAMARRRQLAREYLTLSAASARLAGLCLFHAAGDRRRPSALRSRLAGEGMAYHDAAATLDALAAEIPAN